MAKAKPPPEPVLRRTPQTCGSCGGGALIRLPMVLSDGTEVTFISCQDCEAREWLAAETDGTWTALPIKSVLKRSARRPR